MVDVDAAEEAVRGEPRTVAELLEVGERVLGDSTYIDAEHDAADTARYLLSRCLDADDSSIDEEQRPSARLRERYLSWVARRAAGEPVGLILGFVEFCGLPLRVDRGVFFPRPSAALAVERVLARLPRRRSDRVGAPTVVDLCTGVGPIALAVAAARDDAEVWGADISTRAISLARRNARDLGIENASFATGDLFGALPQRIRGLVDVVVGNIPYVLLEELDEMPAEIVEFEPLSSLTDMSTDGSALLYRAVDEAAGWLRPGGKLIVEIAPESAESLERQFRTAGFDDVDVFESETSWDVTVEGVLPRSARQRA